MINIGSKDEFSAWLKQRRREPIGEARSSEFCPIAKWLKDLNPGALIAVGFDCTYDPKTHHPTGDMPAWAREFMECFDTLVDDGPSYVDGDGALSVLEGVA